jgi:hypothetical protein
MNHTGAAKKATYTNVAEHLRRARAAPAGSEAGREKSAPDRMSREIRLDSFGHYGSKRIQNIISKSRGGVKKKQSSIRVYKKKSLPTDSFEFQEAS